MTAVLFLSDIHLDINSQDKGRDLLPELIQYINGQNPDVVLFSGDLSNDHKTTLRILDRVMQETNATVRFIPGNHDIWVNSHQSSSDAYKAFQHHPSTLMEAPLPIGDKHLLMGDMGWYDYSFGPDTIAKDIFARKKKRLWADGRYARWGKSDTELFQEQLVKMEKQIKQHADKRIILANHFVPFRDFLVFSHSDNEWNFCNAYMGSEQLGRMIRRYPQIEWVIFGHTHKRYGVINDFKGTNIVCSPLGYAHEWKGLSFAEELEHSGVLLSFE